MSPRKVTAVYFRPGAGWVACIRQGAILEQHIVIKRSQNCYDDTEPEVEAEARKLAEALVA